MPAKYLLSRPLTPEGDREIWFGLDRFELDNWLRPEYDPVNRFTKAV
jgi:hypothetical protein